MYAYILGPWVHDGPCMRYLGMQDEMGTNASLFWGGFFPAIGEYLFGGPHHKDYNMLGSVLRSPMQAKHHFL